MSSSDVRMLEELTARVAALEERVGNLAAAVEHAVLVLSDRVVGKDVSPELYGPEANHTADREARAAMVRRPPRA